MSDDGQPTGSDELQRARDQLSEVRNESANRRVENRELKERNTDLSNQVTSLTEAKSAAERARDDKNTELLRLTIALAAGVPGDQAVSVAARLQGSTEAELTADAKTFVAQFVSNQPRKATDPSQGRGGGDKPKTPQEEFAELLLGKIN